MQLHIWQVGKALDLWRALLRRWSHHQHRWIGDRFNDTRPRAIRPHLTLLLILVWQLMTAFPRALGGHEDGLCPLCVVHETGTHIFLLMYGLPPPLELCSWRSRPELQASDMGDFLAFQANCARKRRHLLWFIFSAAAWTLWTTHNKMLIGKVILRHATHSILKLLAFMQ